MSGNSKINRDYLREVAKKRGAKLRITPEGQVTFYGKMPNSEEKGWYFIGWDVDSAVKALILEED